MWRSLHGSTTAPPDGATIVTIGNFDGVHRGHRHVLDRARELATEIGGSQRLPVAAVTFEPHPMRVLAPAKAPTQLCGLRRKIELLQENGADEVYVLAFDAQLAAWSPVEFIDKVLAEDLRAAGVVVGANFHFGAKGSGDVALLREQGRSNGFVVRGLDLSGDERPWSSTYVRSLIAGGDVARASHVLGRLHALEGVIVEGEERGRAMGYPTANMPASMHEAVPADGVYAGYLRLQSDHTKRLPAAISVGSNPTFDGQDRRVESYVLDRDDLELYGLPVEVSFVDRVRGQIKFAGMDDLIKQMHADVEDVRELLP